MSSFWKKLNIVFLVFMMLISHVSPVFAETVGDNSDTAAMEETTDSDSAKENKPDDVISDIPQEQTDTDVNQPEAQGEYALPVDDVEKTDAPSGPLKAPQSNSASKLLQFDFYDRNGNLLSDEDLGGGVTIIYYEIPQGENSYPHSEEEMPAYIEKMRSYRREIVVTKQHDTSYNLTMEEDASPDNPYSLEFSTIDLLEAYFFNSDEHADFNTNAYITYDGTNVNSVYGNAYTDDEGTIHIVIIKNPIAFGKITFSIDISEMKEKRPDLIDYPLYVRGNINTNRVICNTNNGTVRIELRPIRTGFNAFKITEDGEVTVPLGPIDIVERTSNTQMPEQITLQFYSDEQGHNAVNWLQHDVFNEDTQYITQGGGNSFSFYVEGQKDGTYKYHDVANTRTLDKQFHPNFKAEYSEVNPVVDCSLVDEQNCGKYPFYLKLDLTGTVFNEQFTLSKVVKINVKEDLKSVKFDEVLPNSSSISALTAGVYDDEQCTKTARSWSCYQNYEARRLDGNGSLISSDGRKIVCNLMSMLRMPVFKFSSFSRNTEDYPLWLKVRLYMDEEDSEYDETKVFRIDGNTETTLALDKRFPATGVAEQYNARLDYEVINEDGSPDENWSITSEGNRVFVYMDGTINEFNSYSEYEIDIRKTDKLTIPFITRLSDDRITEYFPAELALKVTDRETGETIREYNRNLNTLQDANQPIELEGVYTNGHEYQVTWDINCGNDTENLKKWISGDETITINGNMRATVNGETFSIVYGVFTPAIKITANHPGISNEDFDLPPVWFKVAAYDDSITRSDGYWYDREKLKNADPISSTVIRLDDENLNNVTDVDLGFMVYSSNTRNYYAYWMPYTSDSLETVDNSWLDYYFQPWTSYNEVEPKVDRVSYRKTGKLSGGYGGEGYVYTEDWNGVSVTLKVHTECDEGIDPSEIKFREKYSYSSQISWQACFVIDLYKEMTNGERRRVDSYQDYPWGYETYDDPFAKQFNELGTFDYPLGYLTPGIYYISWYEDNIRYTWKFPSMYRDRNMNWTASKDVKIIVREDGSVIFEDGTPVELTIKYVRATTQKWITPVLNIDTHINGKITNNNSSLYVEIKGAQEENREMDWYAYIWDGNLTDFRITGNLEDINNSDNYHVGLTADNRNGVYGMKQIGTNAQLICLQPGKYIASYCDKYNTAGWTKKDSIPVEFKEDGKLYLIDEEGNTTDEELVIYHHMLPTVENAKLKINTVINEGAKHPFTEGDKVEAVLYRGNYNRKEKMVAVARGYAEIMEPGRSEITLTNVNGEVIYSGNRNDILVSNDTDETNGYSLMVRTVHSDGTVSNLWSWCERNDIIINKEGYITVPSGEYSHDTEDTYTNVSYLLPYPDEVEDPQEVSSVEDGIRFKPVDKLSLFKDKAHYIIAIKNQFDNKWYALSYDEKSGYRALLKDFNIEDVKENGFKVPEGALKQSGYVFTANKTAYSEFSVTTQLKTGVKNAAGKAMGLKFGTSSSNVVPMFDSSVGTMTLEMSGINDGLQYFSIGKNTYASLQFVNEWFGYRGFEVFGPRYMKYEYAERVSSYGNEYTRLVYPNTPWTKNYTEQYRFINDKPYTFDMPENPYRNSYIYEMAEKFETAEYYQELIRANGNNYKPYQDRFIILTDNKDTSEEEKNNEYKLVKTMGDFIYTFMRNRNPEKAMVLVYTDEEGREFALNPKGLVQVRTSELASDYRKLVSGSNNEMIVNNECRNSEGDTIFGFGLEDISGDGSKALITGYPFRKSRTNNYADGEYLTMNGQVWTGNDNRFGDSLEYVMYPSETVYSEADFDKPLSYKLAVYRNGEESWLGVADGRMTIVDSREEAVSFTVYAANVVRYFPDVYSTNYAPYYKISSLDDINEGDEILIVSDKDGKKEVLSNFIYYYYSSYNQYTLTPLVSDEYSEYDSSSELYEREYQLKYRLSSDEPVKKVFAYYGDENSDNLIFSQAVITHLVGSLKSENKKQKKFHSLESLHSQGYTGNKLTIKSDGKGIYRNDNAEVNFIYEDGQFYIRGGKADSWLKGDVSTVSNYDRSTGMYYSYDVDRFSVGNADDRIPVMIYKKGSPNLITINYHDQDGTVTSENKSEGIISLPQYPDNTINDKDYVFVGWSTDPEVTQVLSLEESANLYDFDDISRVAGIKPDIAEKYGLLGNCNPERGNTTKVMAEDLENNTLDLYAVYARRGGTNAVTANDGDRMIIGIADIKDLEEGQDGTTDVRERWLGSVNVEIYKDGELWVPGESTSTDIRRFAMGKYGLGRNKEPEKATMYFAYHNDDAADINIKFIADTVTKEMLDEYMTSNDFSSAEPSQQYVIDAVYAVQGGSEDGLKYKYNWIDPVVGGQLDNVKGGSTVKVYVTTRYQVNYFMDKGDGNGYQELTEDKYQDDNFYMTLGTDNAVAKNRESADYIVKNEEGNEYRNLIQKTPTDTDKFVDENIRRGEYSNFQYEFNKHNNVFPVPELPEAPHGYVLSSDKWTIMDADMNETGTRNPSSDFTIEGTTYGTGNTNLAYLNENYEDITNTFHLYVEVMEAKPETIDLTIRKVWEDNNDIYKLRPDEITVRLMTDGELCQRVILNKENGWEAEVTDLLKYNDGKEIKYTWEEDPVSGYELLSNKTDGTVTTITNKLKKTNLTIEKELDRYFDGTKNLTFVFDIAIVSKEDSSKVIREYQTGLTIDKNATSGKTEIRDIVLDPETEKVVVKEVYSAGYTPDDITVTIDENGTVTAHAVNNFSEEIKGGGVVNNYSDKTYVPQHEKGGR